MRHLLLLVLLTAAPLRLAAAEPVAAAADPAVVKALADAGEAKRVAENKAAIYEAKNQLTNEALANVQIILGAFGTLITVAIFVAGYFSVANAGRAARDEVRRSKDEVDALKAEAQKAFEAVATLQAQIATAAAKIATTQSQAEADAALIREVAHSSAASRPADAAKLAPAEVRRVAEAASAVVAQPESARTSDDYRVLILDALTREDWAAAIDLAEKMRAATAKAETDHIYACQVAAYARAMHGDHSGALAIFTDLVDQLSSQATTMPRREWLAMAMRDRGVSLVDLRRDDDALAAFQAVIDRFGESSDLSARRQVAMAMRDKGLALRRVGRNDEVLAAYDAMIDRFSADTDPEVVAQVAMTMLNKGFALGELDRPDDEIAAYDRLISSYADGDQPAVQQQVAMALVNKGLTFGNLGRWDDAIAAYDAVIAREKPALLEQVAKAMYNRGFVLDRTGRPADAAAAFAMLVARFGDRPEPEIVSQVTNARFYHACLFGRAGNVAAAIGALRPWHAAATDPCAKIAGDADFDPVRNDPAFTAFLAEIGCPPSAPAA